MVDSILEDRFEGKVFCRGIRKFIKGQNELLLFSFFADELQGCVPVGKGAGRIGNPEKTINLPGKGSQVEHVIGFLRREKDSRLVLNKLGDQRRLPDPTPAIQNHHLEFIFPVQLLQFIQFMLSAYKHSNPPFRKHKYYTYDYNTCVSRNLSRDSLLKQWVYALFGLL